nr:polysaccharide biosynthesis tyrosine autokinase [Brevibacterium sp. RIT 803]
MSIIDFLRIVRKNIVLLIVMIAAGGLGGVGVYLLLPDEYTSRTELFVSTVEASNPDQKQIASAFVQERLRTYVDLADSRLVLEPVIRDLDLTISPEKLAEYVSASSDHGTVLLTVSATATTPGGAARVSEAVADSLTTAITDLESRHGKAQSGIRLAVANDASVPSTGSGPAQWLCAVIGILLGAAIGIAIALFRSAVDSKIRDITGVREVTAAPILASVPVRTESSAHPEPTAIHQDSPYAEAIRRLRANLRFARVEDSNNVIEVTSSVPSEGKTSISVNLAISLAQSGQRVVLVDVDLRQPAVADRLGLENSAGLTTALLGTADVHDLLQPWGQDELYVLTAGDRVSNPVELIDSRSMSKLMMVLRNDFDTVILDCPPVLPVADGLLLAKIAGRIIHVIAVNETSRNELEEALNDLSVVETPLSLVVNKVPLGHADLTGYAKTYSARQSSADLPPTSGHVRTGSGEEPALAKGMEPIGWLPGELSAEQSTRTPRVWPGSRTRRRALRTGGSGRLTARSDRPTGELDQSAAGTADATTTTGAGERTAEQ